MNEHRQVLSSVFRYGEGEDTFNLPANPVSAIDERRELPAEGAPLTAAVRDAFMPGFTDAMWVVAFIALLFAAVIALRAPRKSEQATTKAVVPEVELPRPGGGCEAVLRRLATGDSADAAGRVARDIASFGGVTCEEDA